MMKRYLAMNKKLRSCNPKGRLKQKIIQEEIYRKQLEVRKLCMIDFLPKEKACAPIVKVLIAGGEIVLTYKPNLRSAL